MGEQLEGVDPVEGGPLVVVVLHRSSLLDQIARR